MNLSCAAVEEAFSLWKLGNVCTFPFLFLIWAFFAFLFRVPVYALCKVALQKKGKNIVKIEGCENSPQEFVVSGGAPRIEWKADCAQWRQEFACALNTSVASSQEATHGNISEILFSLESHFEFSKLILKIGFKIDWTPDG